MSLYLKYRPSTLEEVRGNRDIIASLEGLLRDKEKCPHTFLFHGPTGCGKTTLARIIATKLECKGTDLIEVDSGQFRGIDTVRDIRSNSQYYPMEGTARVWILDEVHKMTNDAQNALLKILEDTPTHTYFVLCTTDPQKLLPTIRGRCSEFQVQPLPDTQMERLLKKIVTAEQETLTDEVYKQIIQDSLGHPRNALQILEQVLSVTEERRLDMARRTAERQSQTIELCRALVGGSNWGKVKAILEGLKTEDPEGIRRAVLGYCQSALLNNSNDRAAAVIEAFWEPTYNIGFPGVVFACYSVIQG
jgi:DNA polymerase III gamma/tau subunit